MSQDRQSKAKSWAFTKGIYVVLRIKLHPQAKIDEVQGIRADRLLVKVTAPAVDGKANQALVELLAEKLGCAKRLISIEHGQTSREKLVSITELRLEQVVKILAPD